MGGGDEAVCVLSAEPQQQSRLHSPDEPGAAPCQRVTGSPSAPVRLPAPATAAQRPSIVPRPQRPPHCRRRRSAFSADGDKINASPHVSPFLNVSLLCAAQIWGKRVIGLIALNVCLCCPDLCCCTDNAAMTRS